MHCTEPDVDQPFSAAWQSTLFAWLPYDPAKGEEGVSFQGSVLIALLLLISVTAWKGLENIIEGANRWTWVALGLAAATLLLAAAPATLHAEREFRVYESLEAQADVAYFVSRCDR